MSSVSHFIAADWPELMGKTLALNPTIPMILSCCCYEEVSQRSESKHFVVKFVNKIGHADYNIFINSVIFREARYIILIAVCCWNAPWESWLTSTSVFLCPHTLAAKAFLLKNQIFSNTVHVLFWWFNSLAAVTLRVSYLRLPVLKAVPPPAVLTPEEALQASGRPWSASVPWLQ